MCVGQSGYSIHPYMTTLQFTTLSKHQQLRTLLLRAACVADRKTEDTQILLFQLDHCYVEVIFNAECDQVLGTRNFDNMDELQPYLEHINLSSVF